MEIKYAKEKFDGYTHRYSVLFFTKDDNEVMIDIYSNSDDQEKLKNFIEGRKKERVAYYKIKQCTTKEADDHMHSFIMEVLTEKYYYETRGLSSECTEICKVRKDQNFPIYIGSMLCQECQFCLAHNTNEGWIKCDEIVMATTGKK